MNKKPSVKKIGQPGRSETDWSAGQPGEILKFSGRVVKIMIGSISGMYAPTEALSTNPFKILTNLYSS